MDIDSDMTVSMNWGLKVESSVLKLLLDFLGVLVSVLELATSKRSTLLPCGY